jgi:hypothetical protein
MSAPLAGSLQLHPGAALSITGGRPDAARLAIGRQADELPALMGAIFTLCAHAHRFTARRAVAAARGLPDAVGEGDVLALRAATARDQVMRVAHDWPRQLGHGEAGAAEAWVGLRSCPLWRQELPEAERLQRWPDWLAHHWLGMPLPRWLAALDADGAEAVDRWCERAPGRVPALLRTLRADAQQARASGPAWLPLADPQRTMPALAALLAHGGLPLHEGVVPDTGPWSRQRDPLRTPPHNAWMRLVSRFVDLLRLAAPAGAHWLAHGALRVSPSEGIAWTEMARGLLVHWVALDATGTRVEALRVLAPTDLNFHPQGVLARALGALRASGEEARGQTTHARLLAVAFDPCVEFDVAPVPSRMAEATHA